LILTDLYKYQIVSVRKTFESLLHLAKYIATLYFLYFWKYLRDCCGNLLTIAVIKYLCYIGKFNNLDIEIKDYLLPLKARVLLFKVFNLLMGQFLNMTVFLFTERNINSNPTLYYDEQMQKLWEFFSHFCKKNDLNFIIYINLLFEQEWSEFTPQQFRSDWAQPLKV